jgi:hypothetical protein
MGAALRQVDRKRQVARMLSLCLWILAVGLVQAAPSLKTLRPFGAHRGTTFTLTFVGQELTAGSELITTLPATISRLAPSRDLKTPETELPFLVELRPDAPLAHYPVRLRTREGISNVMLFSVSDFPEIEVKKAEDDEVAKDKIRSVSPPVVISSSLKAGEQDVFKFAAGAGQNLVFEVEARRMASAIDPVLRILDSNGREMAFNDDAPGIGVDSRVEVKFPRAGEYRVVVHDSRFSDQEQNFYRLKIGNYLFAESIFPLGGERGKDVDVTFQGGNLPKPLVVRAALKYPPSHGVAMINLPAAKGPQGSLPFPFVLGDLPEILESDSGTAVNLTGDTIVNGRISKAGEKDLYRLAVKPGEKWLFEIQAAGLGTSRLGAYLGVSDGAMKHLASAVDASGLRQTGFSFVPPEKGVDPKLLFTVPEKVEELILSVEDITNRGGPAYGYRLRATRQIEEFALELIAPFINIPAGGSAAISVRVIRDTYAGPIQLSVTGAGDEITTEGGHIPANAREGLIVATAKANGGVSIGDLEVWGEGVSSSQEPIRRRALGPGLITAVKGARREVGGGSMATQKPHVARWLGMQLPVGIAGPPPIAFELEEGEIKLVQGLKQDFPVKVRSNVPLNAPIRIEGIQPLGLDVSIKGAAVDAKTNSAPVQLSSNFNSQIGRFDMVMVARADVNGREVRVVSPCITVELVQAFELVIPEARVQLGSGGKFVLEGKIHRQSPFQEAVHLKVEDLPLHVTSAPVDVPPGESAFRLEFKADPAAQPGEYEVRLVATAQMEGRKDNKDYTIPDVKLRLRIAQTSND